MAKQTIWAFLLIVATAIAAYSQEQAQTTPQDPSQPTTTTSSPAPQPTPTPDYVFPSNAERFRRYVKSTVGPFTLARTAASAGIRQAKDSPEEWGQGMKGYGKRFASGLGRNAIQQTITYGLDEAFDFDTGFERSKRSGFGPRLKDALIQNVTSRRKSGKRVFSVPRFVGVYSAGVISHETWYPERYNYKSGLRSGTRTMLTGFGINVLREFLFNW